MYLNSLGYYVPTERVHNDYFLEVNGLTGEWIKQRTGIETRSKAAANEDINTMAIAAVEDATKNLSYDLSEIDLIVGAGYTPLDTVATLAHVIQRQFNMVNAKCVYVTSACSSYVNALEIVEGYFAMGKAKKALIVCSEHNTYYSNESDPMSGHLWGDAAIATYFSSEKVKDSDPEVLEVFTRGLGHIGKGPEGVYLKPKETGIVMPDGRDVFMNATKFMCEALDHVTAQRGMEVTDLNYIITHQANKRIVANVAHHLNMDLDKFLNNIHEYGNTGSASAVLVLAQNQDKFKKGDTIGLAVFGGGYSSGGILIKY
ncbi:MAG: 3-oxoacyl-ACP synthase III family protein [Bacteroidales bacterium]